MNEYIKVGDLFNKIGDTGLWVVTKNKYGTIHLKSLETGKEEYRAYLPTSIWTKVGGEQ